MKETRSASQILFGHLPDQTVDVAGGIWRVRRWTDAKTETAIDPDVLRRELIKAAWPWKERGTDGEFTSDMLKSRTVRVKSLNRDRGIWCEQFPRLYVCKKCDRLHDAATGRCECGSSARRGQLPFVGYHDACGTMKSPWVKKCPEHKQRAVRHPGTASANELIFFCPICKVKLQSGFAGVPCDCEAGGQLSYNVHRAASVFTPRGITLINPPKREILREIERAGDGERSLIWLLDGMTERRITEAAPTRNPDAVRQVLLERGFDQSTIDAMIAAMPQSSQRENTELVLPQRVKREAESQARQIALATFESRRTVADLKAAAEGAAALERYERSYPEAFKAAGLARIELIDRFPVLTGQFGYTRGDTTPGASRLRTYVERNGEYTVYGELSETEALYVQLDPLVVWKWMTKQGAVLRSGEDRRSAMVSILSALELEEHPTINPSNPNTRMLTTLVHSFAHAFIRKASVFAGIERSALSEVVLPLSFGFFVYAASRGDFVLGGLEALFETELDALIWQLVSDEHRCALDPGCNDNGSACAICLHLGEPSCRMFNTLLARTCLAGGNGYFSICPALVPA